MDVLDAGCVDRSSCDWFLNDLGPPPDAILRIPPPPVPHFIDSDYVVAAGMALTDDPANNDTLCHWCHWARLVDSTSITGSAGTEVALEDTWFFVILAACLMLTLGALLSGLVYLRLHGKTLKGAWDFGIFLSDNASMLMNATSGDSGNVSSVGGVGSDAGSANKPCQQQQTRYSAGVDGVDLVEQRSVASSRALWAGVKTTEGNHYTITHVQPIEQKQRRDAFDDDEDSGVYTTLTPAQNWSGEQRIYYCCANVVTSSPYSNRNSSMMTQVTSLDDSIEADRNPLYVNMSAIHPLAQHSIPVVRTRIPQHPQRPQHPHHFNSSQHVHPQHPQHPHHLHHPHRLYHPM